MAIAKKVMKRKKVAAQHPKLWLTRETKWEKFYEFWIAIKPPHKTSAILLWDHPTVGRLSVCPRRWHAFAPKNYHLKPGGGPVEVKLA